MKPAHRQKLAIQALQKAVRIRKQANIPVEAPINPIDVALHLECPVRFEDISSLEGIYSSDPLAIILGSQRPAGRRSYTCAHEFGHHVFGHGTQIEQLNNYRTNQEDTEIEYLADMFAGFFLMNEVAVKNTLNSRKWDARCITPMQTFMLASYFGVGYSTVVYHLSLTLQIIPHDHFQYLLSVTPKDIKSRFGALAGTEVIIASQHWTHRAADLEAGDTLVLPCGVRIDTTKRLEQIPEITDCNCYIARSPGLARAFDENSDWAINIRISKKNYNGLAEYRHLEDEEYENVSN
jgi:hypothetical protein